MSATDTAIQPQVKALEGKLAVLQACAQAIVVRDADSYREACEGKLAVQTYIKNVGFELDPGIAKAKDTLDHLRNQKAKFVDPAKAILEVFAKKAEAYRTEEKRKAEEETRREQEKLRIETERKAAEECRAAEAQAEAERKKREAEIDAARKAGELKAREAEKLRKQAEADALAAKEAAKRQEAVTAAAVPVVKVEASIPKVAGSKNQTHYEFEVVDASQVRREFLTPDEIKIGEKVRKDKDPEKSMAEIGGIRAWSRG